MLCQHYPSLANLVSPKHGSVLQLFVALFSRIQCVKELQIAMGARAACNHDGAAGGSRSLCRLSLHVSRTHTCRENRRSSELQEECGDASRVRLSKRCRMSGGKQACAKLTTRQAPRNYRLYRAIGEGTDMSCGSSGHAPVRTAESNGQELTTARARPRVRCHTGHMRSPLQQAHHTT